MSIKAKNLVKTLGTPPIEIIRGVCLDIRQGEFVALTGRSGSGKSTLLYLLSTLDNPTSGQLEIDDKDVATLSSKQLHRLRNERIGFVFQFHYLLPELTALENVLMPAMKSNQVKQRQKRAKMLLEAVGLGKKMNRLPRHLSGGEQQRVAIARALVMEPAYLFADEPTGSLDSVAGNAVMDILMEMNRESGTTIVLVTHDPEFASRAKRQIVLADGVVIGDS